VARNLTIKVAKELANSVKSKTLRDVLLVSTMCYSKENMAQLDERLVNMETQLALSDTFVEAVRILDEKLAEVRRLVS
jgi:hypothetical protein